MKKERKIIVIELNPESEDNVIKGFIEQCDVQFEGKIIEMHINKESYERHLKEEYGSEE